MKSAIALASMLVFLGISGFALVTGGSWDRVEGLVVVHQMASATGDSHADPTRIPLYGVVWYRVVGWFGEWRQVLLAGRILSIASCLALAALGWHLLRRKFGANREGAVLGACAWLAWMPAIQFGGVDRCDAPALLVAVLGWCLQLGGNWKSIAMGGMLAMLSSLIRPTSGPEAVLWGLASLVSARAGRQAIGAWIGAASMGAVVVVGCVALLDGASAFENLSMAGKTPLNFGQVVDLSLRIAPLSLPILALVYWRTTHPALRGVVPVIVVLAFLSLARTGANLNWLLSASWFLSMVIGAQSRRIPSGVVVALWLQTIFVQVPRWHGLLEQAEQSTRRMEILRAVDRPILTSDALSVLGAGKTLAIDDPHLLQGLSKVGVFPGGYVLERLRSERWAILTDPDMSDTTSAFWSRELVDWVRDSTRVCSRSGSVRLLVPREAACPTSR